jgi:DNA-binding MarR family transcriptional regulator
MAKPAASSKVGNAPLARRIPLTGKAPAAARTPPPAIKLAADAITLMNRIVSRLFDESSLVRARLGLAEWSILRELAANPALRSAALAKRLGISPQRVTQLVKSMSEARLLTVTRSETDSRVRDIACTALGSERLAAVDGQVLAVFETAFAGRERQLLGLRGNLKRISTALLGEHV